MRIVKAGITYFLLEKFALLHPYSPSSEVPTSDIAYDLQFLSETERESHLTISFL